jgi:hypothetical protein
VAPARSFSKSLRGQVLTGDTKQMQEALRQFPGRKAILILVDQDLSAEQLAELFKAEAPASNGQDPQAALQWIEENAVQLAGGVDTSLENMYSGTLDDPR